MSISLKIALAHWIIIGVCLLMFVSPLARQPGAMHPLLIVPLFYSVFSFVPPLVGVVVGVTERFRGTTKRWGNTGIVLNLVYLVVFVSFVFFMWERWMGV